MGGASMTTTKTTSTARRGTFFCVRVCVCVRSRKREEEEEEDDGGDAGDATPHAMGARAHARRRRGCRRRASSRVEDAQRASEGWCDLNVYRIVRAVHGALARARARARGPIRARARGGWKTPIRGKTPKFGFFS